MTTDLHGKPQAATFLSLYADDVAFVTEEAPATTLQDFINQLSTASSRLDSVGINGAEELDTAAIYLSDAAHNASGTDQIALFNQADEHLRDVTDMVDEYRLMV
ncbi:hypothetical protein [Streptomyces yunnanensis]|uniref:Uncharacterized protein n=1 Tax=Streptomyces yunnanensis TaxID=156453 RepID=A0A9X8QSB7_9ACTN|nr:hypothetical protein [Streptomyces yunnanensis]SHL75200.1 hypothetical protein SAMN05216268_10674 [Streptomyces yunnanensis]